MAAHARRGENTGTALRWGACFALVLAVHASVALLLLRRSLLPEQPVSAPEAVMLDLAPEPAVSAPALAPSLPEPQQQPAAPPLPAPELEPAPEPPRPVEPAPPQPQPSPEPMPQGMLPPAPFLPNPAVALPELSPPPPPSSPSSPKRPAPIRPVVRPQPPRPAQTNPPMQASGSPAPNAAPVPATPSTVPLAAASNAVPGWRSELVGRLQRAKRYPDAARARGEQGVATVTFTIDRSGHVLSVSLVRSSGSQSLDEEAVALVRRADPLPQMPAELANNKLTLTLPVTFSLR